jgi:hypothetical protein
MPGLDRSVLDTIDFSIVINRIQVDVRSDFILAPHYNAIFVKAKDELAGRTQELLRSGKYEPDLPLTMDVPKGRGFTRPGSILHPIDRVVYQALADAVAPTLESHLDRNRSFAQVITDVTSTEHLFEYPQESWEQHQNKLSTMCKQGGYFVKADVANYFERIPQHHLVNLMYAADCKTEIVKLIEEILLAFQERNSYGIIQGVFPSDLFGNFFLSDLDAFCELHDIESSRYVDDVYMRFETEKEAYKGLMKLIGRLRRDGLHLNEYKSGIHTADELIKEETEIDQMFAEVRQEIEAEISADAGYGFDVEWELDDAEETEEEEIDEEELHIAAVARLYSLIEEYPYQSDKIEKFCLPLLRAANSDVAVDRSLESITSRPDMTKLHLSYLSKFTPTSPRLVKKLEDLLVGRDIVSDYQLMYLLGALMNCKDPQRSTTNIALNILQNKTYPQELRSVTAIFAAKHGNPQQQRTVRIAYEEEPSMYVRAAILYASRHFVTAEQRTCKKAWGGHGIINSLITQALKNS